MSGSLSFFFSFFFSNSFFITISIDSAEGVNLLTKLPKVPQQPPVQLNKKVNLTNDFHFPDTHSRLNMKHVENWKRRAEQHESNKFGKENSPHHRNSYRNNFRQQDRPEFDEDIYNIGVVTMAVSFGTAQYDYGKKRAKNGTSPEAILGRLPMPGDDDDNPVSSPGWAGF